MTNLFQIADIKLQFDYNFNEFFEDRIGSYAKADIIPDHFMKVTIESHIERPKGILKLDYKDRHLFEDGNINYLFKEDETGSITDLIKYDKDFKHIEILLSDTIGSRLPEVEYLLTGMMFFEIALENSRISIHASAISYNDEAILFSAPSQTGKSTQAELWSSNLEGVRIINDDKPVLFLKDNVLWASGTPWSGKTARNENITNPVKCIVFLEQSSKNELLSLSNQEIITYFLRNIHRPKEEHRLTKILTAIETLVYQTPVYLYKTTKEQSSFDYLYYAIYRGDHL